MITIDKDKYSDWACGDSWIWVWPKISYTLYLRILWEEGGKWRTVLDYGMEQVMADKRKNREDVQLCDGTCNFRLG